MFVQFELYLRRERNHTSFYPLDVEFFVNKILTMTLMLIAREKTLGAGEKLEDFETHFCIK
jgi:hypothetical protein